MKKLIQILIIVWFLISGGVVLAGGVFLMMSGHREVTAVPDPPPPPDWKGIKAEDAAKLYAAQVSAYEKHLEAIRAKSSVECAPCLEVYKTVAKDTFQPLLNTILAALLGYVFVKGTATLINNQMRMRSDKELERLEL